LSIYGDGDPETPLVTETLEGIASLGNKLWRRDFKEPNLNSRYYKYRIDASADTTIYGIEIELADTRTIEAS